MLRLLRIRSLGAIQKFSTMISAPSVISDIVVYESDSRKLIKDLTTEFKNSALIEEIFLKHPELTKTTLKQWKTCIDLLTDYDFRIIDGFNMISGYPELLKLSPEYLQRNLGRWFDCRFGVVYFKFLLMNCPYFLHIPVKNIEQRVPYLKSLAPRTMENRLLLILLIQCPSVMYEDWNSVTSKINYLKSEMRVDVEEIFRSLALSKSFDHIKIRHSLLEKCGLYVAPTKWIHKKDKLDTFNNPHLKRITDNADISFSRKIAKISEEEYTTYWDLWKQEINEKSDDSD